MLAAVCVHVCVLVGAHVCMLNQAGTLKHCLLSNVSYCGCSTIMLLYTVQQSIHSLQVLISTIPHIYAVQPSPDTAAGQPEGRLK